MFRLLGCSAVRRIVVSGGAPVAVRRFCAVPELNLLFGSAFRVRFSGPLSEPAFRTRFPGLLRVCSGSASGLFRVCFGFVPGLFRACSGSVSGLFRVCFGPVSGSASGPASGSAFGSAQELFPGLLSGLVSRMLVLFCLIAECGVWFRSGRRIRLCDFCRSKFRWRACNSLLPVFHGLRREPVI